MDAFVRVLTTVKAALERTIPTLADLDDGERRRMVEPPTHDAEMVSVLAHELEALNANFIGAMARDQLASRIVELARQASALNIAVGTGTEIDLKAVATALETEGCQVLRPVSVEDETARKAWLMRLARADMGIVEARYAIASSGALLVVASPASPGSLTLLPPISTIIVRADQVVGTLAQAIELLGPTTVAQHRIVIISGPSRTADIEKRIVLGVHGPRELHVAVVWPDGV
jgi:L-lactate dehydrogenase complex protein LldG